MKQHRPDSFCPATPVAFAVFVGILPGAVSIHAQDAKPPDPTPPEKKKWETSANAGVTLAQGNSKAFLASAGINSTRKWSRDEILMGANGGYGESTAVNRADRAEDETTRSANFVRGFAQWNHLFTERVFAGLRLDGLHDDVADVYYRFTLSPLAGYYFIKKPATTLAAELGPSFIAERVGEEDDNTYVGARLGERFEHKFKTGARIWQTAEVIPQIDDVENFIVNLELGVEAPLTKKLSVRAVVQDTYDHQPAELTRADGTTAHKLKNDLKLIAGLAYKF